MCSIGPEDQIMQIIMDLDIILKAINDELQKIGCGDFDFFDLVPFHGFSGPRYPRRRILSSVSEMDPVIRQCQISGYDKQHICEPDRSCGPNNTKNDIHEQWHVI